jgi:hypothetical protein
MVTSDDAHESSIDSLILILIIYLNIHTIFSTSLRRHPLKRTKLEDYIAILHLLQLTQRPLQVTEIQSETQIEEEQLKKDLTFLIEQKAIERRPLGVSHAFFVAPAGDKLVRYFNPAQTTT